MKENISVKSTKEEIADYFKKTFKISENTKNNLIKEDISGDLLLDLTDEDFEYLEIPLGRKLRIKKYLEENSEKFKPKELQEKITTKSNNEAVKNFLTSSSLLCSLI